MWRMVSPLVVRTSPCDVEMLRRKKEQAIAEQGMPSEK
jgi:hypothetical protein